MERIPNCWRDCEDEDYRKQILNLRENILNRLDQAAENIFRIKRLMHGGKIPEIINYFVEDEYILATCREALTSSLIAQCENCEHRKIE